MFDPAASTPTRLFDLLLVARVISGPANPMYEISATIHGHGCERENIFCFDPNIVIGRLREVFPDAEVDPKDHAWKDFEGFLSRGLSENDGAVRIALSDATRRGPIYGFRLPVGDGRFLKGHAERYVVVIRSDEPIPEPTRSKFLHFLATLKFAPCIDVRCVRLDGNDAIPV